MKKRQIASGCKIGSIITIIENVFGERDAKCKRASHVAA